MGGWGVRVEGGVPVFPRLAPDPWPRWRLPRPRPPSAQRADTPATRWRGGTRPPRADSAGRGGGSAGPPPTAKSARARGPPRAGLSANCAHRAGTQACMTVTCGGGRGGGRGGGERRGGHPRRRRGGEGERVPSGGWRPRRLGARQCAPPQDASTHRAPTWGGAQARGAGGGAGTGERSSQPTGAGKNQRRSPAANAVRLPPSLSLPLSPRAGWRGPGPQCGWRAAWRGRRGWEGGFYGGRA